MSEPKIIYEDGEVLVLDKPPGWVVNDAKTAHDNPIIQNWLKSNFSYGLAKSYEKRSGIVHRLDKETSGILLVAKTDSSYDFLQDQFKKRIIKKGYIALVHGNLKDREGVVTAPISRLPWNREKFGVVTSGKEAETSFTVTALYKDREGNIYSLIRLTPKTGRTHQIRVHMKYIGHPLVSDFLYAGRKTARNDRLWCKRVFLHASYISFDKPGSGERITIESNLAPDLRSSLEYLQKVE